MMWCFWGAKGGVGCTVAATVVALRLSRDRPVLLVDLGGDVAQVLGRSPQRTGLAQWLEAAHPPPDALARLEAEMGPGLGVLSWGDPGAGPGTGPEVPATRLADRVQLLTQLVDFGDRPIVVDVGLPSVADHRRTRLAEQLLAGASRSTLVTRACHLAVRAAQPLPPPDDVIVVARRGRALRSAAISAALGAPVVAEIGWDPAVARAVDGGRLGSRSFRSMRPLNRLAIR